MFAAHRDQGPATSPSHFAFPKCRRMYIAAKAGESCVYVCVYMRVCVSMCMCMCICTCMCTRMCTRMYTCMCTCVHTRVCTCVHTHVCTCIWTWRCRAGVTASIMTCSCGWSASSCRRSIRLITYYLLYTYYFLIITCCRAGVTASVTDLQLRMMALTYIT